VWKRKNKQSELIASAELLDWRSIYFVTGIFVKVDLFYSILFYLMDTFAPKHLVRVRAGDDMCGVRNWLDNRVRLAISERNYSYNVWNSNVNRIRGNHPPVGRLYCKTLTCGYVGGEKVL
jgi:hypothetical protein